jgi:hypothetical protein
MLLFYGGSSDVVLTVGSGDPFKAISLRFGGCSVRLFRAAIPCGDSVRRFGASVSAPVAARGRRVRCDASRNAVRHVTQHAVRRVTQHAVSRITRHAVGRITQHAVRRITRHAVRHITHSA